MICPKCKCEYDEGYTKCSDCDLDLISKEDKVQISEKGISIIKFGLGLLFFAIFQIILVIIVYEFYMVYKLSKVGVTGTLTSNIHPIIITLSITELITSICIIRWGMYMYEIVKK